MLIDRLLSPCAHNCEDWEMSSGASHGKHLDNKDMKGWMQIWPEAIGFVPPLLPFLRPIEPVSHASRPLQFLACWPHGSHGSESGQPQFSWFPMEINAALDLSHLSHLSHKAVKEMLYIAMAAQMWVLSLQLLHPCMMTASESNRVGHKERRMWMVPFTS